MAERKKVNLADTPSGAVIYGMPADEYHASPGVSNSMLSDLAKSPAHCWALHHNPARPERKATAAMRAGTLLHTLVLEPAEVPRRYIVAPEGLDLRTKAGKDWKAQADGLEVLTAEQYLTAEQQADAIRAVPELAALLASGQSEVSCFWTDPATGLECRMRADWVHPLPDGRAIVLDLKTTGDVSPEGFGRSVWSFGYHRQAAHYSAGFAAAAGVEVAAFLFGAVTNEYPFIAMAYMLADEDLQRGRAEVRRLLDLYAECTASNHWPAFGAGVQLINLPAWAKKDAA
jgi:hypothetical protein